jgi:hypothetical protein
MRGAREQTRADASLAREALPKSAWSLLRHRHHEPRVRAPSASLMCLLPMTHPLGRLRDAEHAYREASGSPASSPARLVGVPELEAGVEGVAGKPRRTPPTWDARTPEPKRLRRSRWDADTFSARVSPPSTRGERDARVATRRLDETPAPTRAADAASENPETDASPTKTSGDAPANLGVAEVAERAAAELRDRARVRVFHLPRALTERDVREMFTSFGELEEVRLLPSDGETEIDEGTRESGVSSASASASASASVAFASADAASAALRLDGLLIGDRHLHVSRPASARAPDPPERAPNPPPAPKFASEPTPADAASSESKSKSAAVCASIQAAADYAAAVNASLARETETTTTTNATADANEPPPRPLAAENPARLYVGNVPFSMRERELEALFATFGPLVSCHLVLSTSGSAGDGTNAANAAARAAAARGGVGHRGYGFVEYASRAAADAAMATMSGFELAGRRLRVRRAKPLADPVKSAAARVNHAATAVNNAVNNAVHVNGDGSSRAAAEAAREVIRGGRSALSALAARFRDAARVRRPVAVETRRG